MKQSLIRTAVGAVGLLTAVAAMAATTGAAGTGPQRHSDAGCVASHKPGARSNALSAAGATSALHSYDDHIEDVVTAPDICSSNMVTNDNEVIVIGLHAHDRSRFAPGDGYSVFLDTDSDSATGATAESGYPAGTEYVIDMLDGSSTLRRWSGAAFDPVTTQSTIVTGWVDTYGPALAIDPADLGSPQGFKFVFVTTNGTDRDLAPDTGMWSYTWSPLTLKAGRLAISPARAGALLVAGMEVTRSDFDMPLDEGAITCRATVGSKTLAGRGRFVDESVACGWRVPRTARGKRVTGSVMVTFQDVTAKRSFSVRVR
jgi:hypothetical protein